MFSLARPSSFVCLSVCLFVCVSVCLSVCLSVSLCKITQKRVHG